MTNQSHRVLLPIIFGTTIFFILFGLKPLYTNYMDINTQSNSVMLSRDSKQKTLDDLNLVKLSLESASGTTEFIEKVKRLSKPWNEANIMASIMLNDFTRSSDIFTAPITISSISLDKGKKLPNGLSLGTAELVIGGRSIDDVVNFLTQLTTNAPYIYTFNSIKLPISAPSQDNNGGFSLSLSLGIYYYE